MKSNKPKTYNYGHNEDPDEVQLHVRQATRDLPDPIFLTLAHQAAVNGTNLNLYSTSNGNKTGCQGVTFHYPTTHPRGYFSLLQYIISHPNCRRKDITTHFQSPLTITLTRLLDAQLIRRPNHRYEATELGITYATSAANHLVSH